MDKPPLEERSDFEKLHIAKLLIKKLHYEIGFLKSEIDELKHELHIAKHHPDVMTEDEKIKIKTDERVKQLQVGFVTLQKHLKRVRKENKTLIYKLVKAEKELEQLKQE